MAIAINIDVNTSKKVGAPNISVSELKEMIQNYVNSLRVNVIVPQEKVERVSSYHHSLSSLRGICKSKITDEQALDEYLSRKYQ